MVERIAAADTVSVGCKLPNGLVLQLCKSRTENEQVMGGGTREVTVWRKWGPRYVVRGNGHPSNNPLKNSVGITHGIPASFMREWLEQNKDTDLVRNHQVFIETNDVNLHAKAREHKDEPTGLEPIRQTGDPRMPKARTINGGAKLAEVTLAERDE